MSEADRLQQGGDPWKQKYYDILQQLEAKEQRWAELEALLRRAVTRLSLVADGHDAELDTHLTALREAVRSGDDISLTAAVDGLSKVLARLDRQDDSAAGRRLQAALAKLLDRVPLEGDAALKARALRERLVAAQPAVPLEELIDEFAALLSTPRATADGVSAIIQAPQEKPAKPRRGLLAGLFARPDGKGVLARLLDGLVVPPALQGELAALRKRADAAADQAAQYRIADELLTLCNGLLALDSKRSAAREQPRPCKVLLQLLDNLAVPQDLGDRLESVKAKLEAGVAPTQWGEVLADIAGMVTGMRTDIEHERDELEHFLAQLTERLHELERQLAGADSTRAASLASGRQLNTAVQDHVRSIESSVQEAVDIDQLKHTIQTRLDAIRTHMETHRRAEEERNAQLEAQLKELNERLYFMEREAEELHARIAHEHRQALIDPLSGIGNRLAYDERIALEFARWKRTRAPLTLILWDVDRFKHINDTYGHKAGDKVLKIIANLLVQQVRETDFVARYGGEEFVMLLTNTSAAQAVHVAEKVRRSVETCGFHYSGQAVSITISCGLADFQEGDTPENVFERADAALYRAKQAGRNRCCR